MIDFIFRKRRFGSIFEWLIVSTIAIAGITAWLVLALWILK